LTRRTTTEEFILKAKAIHGDTYDYSLVKYITLQTKVKVICPEHGIFEQTPANHLKGSGCRKCSTSRNAAILAAPAALVFKENAHALHGGRYGYEQVEYVASKTKVKIVCEEHGVFEITPSDHLSGRGCSFCGLRQRAASRSAPSAKTFSERARAVHGDKYDYSPSIYSAALRPVRIICREHGEFLQNPGDHLSGKGCPSCAITGFQREKPAVVYVFDISTPCGRFTGFGISGSYKSRLRQHIRTLAKHSANIERMFSIEFDIGRQAADLELLLQQTFPLSEEARNIEGFKTESTTATFSEVVAFVEKIKGEMDNGCT